MMKSSFESLSAVTLVVWIRLETEAPKKAGDVVGEAGVEGRNWTPESGADSGPGNDWGPGTPPAPPGVRDAGPLKLLNPGEPTRISVGWPALITPTCETE